MLGFIYFNEPFSNEKFISFILIWIAVFIYLKDLYEKDDAVKTLKLDIDSKSHAAWIGGSQKILDKGRVSKFNKRFSNLRSAIKK